MVGKRFAVVGKQLVVSCHPQYSFQNQDMLGLCFPTHTHSLLANSLLSIFFARGFFLACFISAKRLAEYLQGRNKTLGNFATNADLLEALGLIRRNFFFHFFSS